MANLCTHHLGRHWKTKKNHWRAEGKTSYDFKILGSSWSKKYICIDYKWKLLQTEDELYKIITKEQEIYREDQFIKQGNI